MKKLLIFDLDGTLLNTLQDLANAVNYALESFHYETKSLEHVRKSIGNGVAILISRCIENGFENPHYDEVLKTFRNYYSNHYLDNTLPYKNMRDTLLKLKENGYLLAVVTNKINSISNDLINHFFPGIFSIVQGDVKEMKKKPDREMVDYVLKNLGIKKEEALYIGDTNVDYETAKNAEMDALLVTYGFRNHQEMDSYHIKCDRIDSIEEILDYLTNNY